MALSDFVTSHFLISLSLAILPVISIGIGLYDVVMRYINPSGRRVLPYPPGPPPASYIAGHITQVPQTNAWEGYAKWAKQYGDMIYFRIYREHNIILHRLEDAIELFEKRSGIYSDRKHSAMINMMGWEFNTGLKIYDDSWRHHRRMLKKYFEKDKIHAYAPVQKEKMKRFLNYLLDAPDDFRQHVKRLTTSTILSILYGHNLSDDTIDYFVDIAEHAVDALVEAMIPGSSVVDQLPFLRHVPTWFPSWVPGVKFKRLAQRVKKFTLRMQEEPIKLVGKELAEGTAGYSIVAELLENCYKEAEYVNTREMAATAYAAGAETTVAGLETFFLAMMLFPDVQKKAQLEIDRVTGRDRLVDHEDRPALPYIEALYRELMRWRPPMPFPVAHTTTDDDVYRGYFIPKGTVILANTWAMAHNEEKYPEPDILKPERFLNADGTLNDDDFILTFGYGRRICPGRYLAGSTTWLTIASVLSAFNIRTKDGKPGVIPGFTNGAVSHPLPFECSITVRSEEAANLIHSASS